MDKTFKYNSRQPLVHRDCHQLPKPNMGAPHVLSISPILVIDDNHFQESLYKELCITMQCNNQRCMRMGCKCLGTKTKARRKLWRLLHKTLWNSPIGIDCQNGRKAKKTNIKGVPPKVMYFSTREWNAIHISNGKYLEEDKLYWGPKIAKEWYATKT